MKLFRHFVELLIFWCKNLLRAGLFLQVSSRSADRNVIRRPGTMYMLRMRTAVEKISNEPWRGHQCMYLWKIGTANAICWNSLCLFRDYGRHLLDLPDLEIICEPNLSKKELNTAFITWQWQAFGRQSINRIGNNFVFSRKPEKYQGKMWRSR